MFDEDDSNELEGFIEQHFSRLSKKELNRVKARLRNAISRESAKSKTREQEMVSSLIAYASKRDSVAESLIEKRMRQSRAVVTSVSQLSSTVLKSIGVKAPIHVDSSSSSTVASGRTDFKKIYVSVNDTLYNPNDRDSIARLIHITKGLVYHEGGHIKWTTPYADLVALSGMELTNDQIYQLKTAWNILEDQRMETAMCSLSPVLGKYFTSIVLGVVMNLNNLGSNWPWIAGRTYLPADIRQAVRDSAEHAIRADLIPRINTAVMGYRSATTAKEMMQHVIDFQECLTAWGGGGRNTDAHTVSYHDLVSDDGNGKPIPMPDSIPQTGDFKLEEPSSTTPKDSPKGGESPSSTTSSGVGGSPGDEGNREPTMPKASPPSTEEDKEKLHERFKEEIKQNIEDVNSREVDDFISSVNEVVSKDVMPNRTISAMSTEQKASSLQVAANMMSVLESLVVQVEPTWQMYKEDGIIDPTLFALREPGDTNFWAGLDGEGGNGHDIALSVLIDSSGSMGTQMEKVSIAAMGVKKACVDLGIPCTVTTFNDRAEMVSEADGDFDFVTVDSEGGTAILEALMNLEAQRCGKTHHLVIILTDGEWYDVSDLRAWAHPTRTIVIAGFGNMIQHYISTKSADHWLVIDDVLDLYKVVTESLVGYLV